MSAKPEKEEEKKLRILKNEILTKGGIIPR